MQSPEEGWMGTGRKVLNERQVSHDPYKRRRGDEGCFRQPESSVVRTGWSSEQPVSLAAVPPPERRKDHRETPRIQYLLTVPIDPASQKGRRPNRIILFGLHSLFYTKMQFNCR